VSSGNNRRMVFIIEGSRTEVDEADLTVKQDTSLTCISRYCSG
jgi:hypothetical protein